MLVVPLQAVPSQTLGVAVGGQSVTLNIYTKQGAGFTNLYMDVLVLDALIIGGVICQNGRFIVRDGYLGFAGDFAFLDTQGQSDPVYNGLGARYQLVYFEATDYPLAASAA